MKLLFLILAHDRPEQVLELTRVLIEGAGDAVAMIHYDRRSPDAEFAELKAAAAADARIRLVTRRAATAWGQFGLVEAPLNALSQAEEEGIAPDYVILLSGACLPCRPIAQLERYLEANSGREFIESEDEGWVTDGWRSERWRYRFWFNHRSQRPLEWAFFHAQRLLRIERRFPTDITPRFGSQWWALTWDTCRTILRDIRRRPERLAFFRSVWIPDEMVFQTYVGALVHPDKIMGFGLTHFQFSNRGKPVVFHDDHQDYVLTLERFFVRKVSSSAGRLRAMLLEVAAKLDDGAPLESIGTRRRDYAVKTAAQTNYPLPGQLFYRDQHADMIDPVLRRAEEPYVVLVGPPALTQAVASHLPEPPFTRLGAVFAPSEVDLGEEEDTDGRRAPRAPLQGLSRGDMAIRDMHPALYLVRLRARCDGVPVVRWSPFDAPVLLTSILRDPQALVLACLPYTGVEARDRRLLALAARGDLGQPSPPTEALSGIRPEHAALACADDLVAAQCGWLDWLGKDLFYLEQDGEYILRRAIIALPWNPRDSVAKARQRRRIFEDSLAACRFAAFPWYSSLRRALRSAWEVELNSEVLARLGPLSPAALAAFDTVLGLSEPQASPEDPELTPREPPEVSTEQPRTTHREIRAKELPPRQPSEAL